MAAAMSSNSAAHKRKLEQLEFACALAFVLLSRLFDGQLLHFCEFHCYSLLWDMSVNAKKKSEVIFIPIIDLHL